MTVASVASSHSKKLMKFTLSIFSPRFSSSRCKTAAKMAVARIKLLRNKREVVVRQMKRDIALLLESGQDATARVRVEHVIREQNVLAANEFIELFCELVVARLTIIAKQRECPADLKEGIASLIFAAPRCAEIPELGAIVKIFEKKYGKDFVSAATDLRPNCGVNRILIDKLSVRTPTGEVKLKIMKEIAKEYQIDWDTAESEKELLKAPEERIEGPNTFISASSLPVKPTQNNVVDIGSTNEGALGNIQFQDTASAAEAAAESAKQAIAAAQAAAHLANKNFNPGSQAPGFDHKLNASAINTGFSMLSGNTMGLSMANDPRINCQVMDYQSQGLGRIHEPQNFERSNYASTEETRSMQMDGDRIYRRHSYNETRPNQMDGHNVHRRHSYNTSSPKSEIKFDESDCDEEIEMEESPAGIYAPPPKRPPPPVPSSHIHQVHPKLPDYDSLAARFEALKYQRSQT
ncbi:protein with unknown function [Ricinus communis]|uniref:IST1-like protein n=1 Tax=Ricinus communis TaxID=3988 RepID=B9S6Q8_RICCO|nr:protein with unknown function [Ricinus communis]|eukprot:XP_002521677.1 vacuolar protein sorting-associated protein ist1 [Ricinus communis]